MWLALWLAAIRHAVPLPLSVQSTSHSKSNTRTPARAEMGGGRAEREADNHACASSSPSLAGPLLTLKQCFLDPPPPSPSKYQRQGGPNNNSDAGALSKPCYFQPAPAPSSALVGLVGLVGCILTALRHNFSGTATHPPASLLYFLAQSPFPQQRDQKCRQNGPFPGPAPQHGSRATVVAKSNQAKNFQIEHSHSSRDTFDLRPPQRQP